MKKIIILFLFSGILLNSVAQNVGIGIAIPNANALLHVDLAASTNKGILVSGTVNNLSSNVPDLGEGARLMYYPGKSAFRAGYVAGNEWNNVNVGLFSTAFGHSSIARGENSMATGYFTSAGGSHSSASGTNTVAKNYASSVLGMYNDSLLIADETTVTPSSALLIVGNGNDNNNRSNAMLVRKNGNVEVENLVVGSGTVISKQQAGTATVGPNASAFKVFTFSFPQSFAGIPKIVATARHEAGANYDDTFVVAIRSVSSTSVTFNILRVDQNALWAQNLLLDWMAWE